MRQQLEKRLDELKSEFEVGGRKLTPTYAFMEPKAHWIVSMNPAMRGG